MAETASAPEPHVSLAEASLRELQERYPLPPGWTLQETFMQDLSLGPLTLYMVGLVATDHKQSALGSSTQADGYPVDRAYFELLERISIYEAHAAEQSQFAVRDARGVLLGERSAARVFPRDLSPLLRTSLSNGVALHATWERACSSALHELIERDRILRSFAGEIAPVRVDAPSELGRALEEQFESAAYELGMREPAPRHRTAMLFMLPRAPEHPITYGFGTDYTLEAALARAEREAMQRLAFLWDEALPDAPVPPTATPDFHQDFYLYPPNHLHLRAWLAGELKPRHARQLSLPLFDGEPVTYIDLTPAALRGKLAVAKAISPSTRRLRFGLPAFPLNALPHPLV